MAQNLVELNATVLVNDDATCAIMDTSRIYDLEAENLFGSGFLALQLHTIQDISILSDTFISVATVVEVISNALGVATGGQRLFLNCLHQYDGFASVLSIKLRRGLSAWEGEPTFTPSNTTASPTSWPVPSPTETPSAQPISEPPISTNSPTDSPSVFPTEVPSHVPSPFPTKTVTSEPSIAYSQQPTQSPTTFQGSTNPIGISPPILIPTSQWQNSVDKPKQGNGATSDPLVIAAIAGATATAAVTCVFVAGICWRRRRPIPKRRSQPKYALTSKDGQLSKDNLNDMIPGFVELDQRSLAETTLGDQTAGISRETKPKALRPAHSFDENSLYTTPFSVQRDEVMSYYQTHVGPSILASQVVRPREHSGNILLPLSDSATTSSDGVSSFGPPSSRLSNDGNHTEMIASSRNDDESHGPIDLDTHKPYINKIGQRDPPVNRFRDHTTAKIASQSIDEGSVVDDMSTWSYDFEEFDRGSDFYQAESQSRSPSHSSRSTAKVKNLSSARHYADGSEIARHHVASGASNRREPTGLYKEIKNDQEKPHTTMPSLNRAQEHLSSWSSWSSLMLHDTSTRRREVDTSHGSTHHNQSPLSKLLDSVTQAVSPLHSTRSIPTVTPEETESDVDQPTETSLSREDDSTLLGLQFKDEASASTASTGMSASPWLLEKVEESLGPKSVTADMESLSGKSNLSRRSTSNRSKAGGSMVSGGSYLSYRSGFTHNEIAFTPRTLEHDLKRLEMQLAALDNDQVSTSSAGVSSITGASLAKASVSSRSRGNVPKVSRKKRIVVIVPAGKLGVILANRHDGRGTVVSEIRESSPLYRMLSPGDKLVAVDDDDVAGMVVSQITSLMASRADRERRLTVITSVPQQYSK